MPSKAHDPLRDAENKPKAQHKRLVFPLGNEENHPLSHDILTEDGYIKPKSVTIIKAKTKVHTPSAHILTDTQPQSASLSFTNDQSMMHSKHNLLEKHKDLKKIRKKFSFSWAKFGRRIALGALVLGLLVIIAGSAVAAWAVDVWNNTPAIDALAQPNESSVVYARDGKTILFKYFKEERREIVPVDENPNDPNENHIPLHMELAILALEDENFYYNDDGVPWRNIVGATMQCIFSGGQECRGASGLSQQTVKNLTGDKEESLQRKVRELFTAIKLNQEKNKKEIIGLYLNTVPFGRNAYGVQEAAKSYFGVDIKDIEIPQACVLASMVQQPSYFNSGLANPDSTAYKDLVFRKNACLEKMYTNRLEGPGSEPFIKSQEELNQLKEADLKFVAPKVDYPYPHFREYVTDELKKFGITDQMLFTRGYKIVTTLDPQIQQKVEEAARENEQKSVIDNGANNMAAMVVDGPSGQILAMLGSRDYNNAEIDGQVNIATSPQQPGSSIKPYVYASAFNQGFNPATMLWDAQMNFDGGFRPSNFAGSKGAGVISIRTALQNSYNVTAVKGGYLSAGEGNQPNARKALDNFFDFSESMGLRYPCIPSSDGDKCKDPNQSNNAFKDRCYMGSMIGGCEVTMVSHITGINTLAQNGNLRTATPFMGIWDAKSKVDIYRKIQEGNSPVYPQKDAVINPLIAKQMQSVLSDYRARYRAFCGGGASCQLARNLELAGWDGPNAVAAKTGTSDEARDTWTVGFTPYYTVTTWIGNTDNKPLKNTAAASSAAAPFWNSIMVKIHEGKEKKGFDYTGLQKVQVDTQTGFLVKEGGATEYMTDEQVKILNDAAARVAKLDYNPRQQSIFNNRSVMVLRRLKINKIDGKIAVEGKTLPQNIDEVSCVDAVSEFPLASSWFPPNNTTRYPSCNIEVSDQDQVSDQNSKPQIETNLSPNNNSPSQIRLKANPTGSNNKTIKRVEILVDGEVKASNDGNETILDSSAIPAGTRTVLLKALDSNGISNEITFGGVIFGSSNNNSGSIGPSDIGALNISCSSAKANEQTSCSINLNGKKLPSNFKIKIGSAPAGGNCPDGSGTINCSSVPTPSFGFQPIRIQIGDQTFDTNKNVLITI